MGLREISNVNLMNTLLREKIFSHCSMIAFSIFVSGSFTFGSLIADSIDPELLTFYRFLLATLLLGIILHFKKSIHSSHFKKVWRYFVLGAIYSTYFVFMFVALKYTTTVSTAAIFTLLPLFAAIMERLFLRKKSPLLIWLALISSGCGAIWIIFEGSIIGLLQFRFEKGEAIFLVGTIVYASYAIIQPKLFKGENIYVTTLGVLAAGSIILAISLILQQSSFIVDKITFEVFWVIFYLSIFASIGSISCLNYASPRLSAPVVSAYTLLVPFWVILNDFVFFKIAPNMNMIVGAMLIALGLLILIYRS